MEQNKKLPTDEQSKIEREEILRNTEEQIKLGRKIVTVQGMGFVGCVMAVVVANAENEKVNYIIIYMDIKEHPNDHFGKFP